MKTAIVTSVLILSSAASAFAGSATLNSTYRETGSGQRWVSGHTQSQNQTLVNGVSTSVKGEYGVPAGQQGARQWGVQVGINGGSAYCNSAMSNGGDPYLACATDTTKTQSITQSNTSTSFGEDTKFHFEQFDHRVGAGSF